MAVPERGKKLREAGGGGFNLPVGRGDSEAEEIGDLHVRLFFFLLLLLRGAGGRR